MATNGERLSVAKTYKMYVGGKFPRTESGRFYPLHDKKDAVIANVCRGTRKDFRDAVVAARSAQAGWSGVSAYLRGQILYRIAEMLEGRKAQFVQELTTLGQTKKSAETEVSLAVDRLVHYAGWADKYQQIFSAVNPVASSHFNFSVLEPMGVVAIAAPEQTALVGLVSNIAPAICGGNTCVVLASETKPLPAISFAEVMHSSDVPGGVVNILTGFRSELLEHFASHMDVNALVYNGERGEELKTLQTSAALNMKRVIVRTDCDSQSPYLIKDTQETKTTWHPIGI